VDAELVFERHVRRHVELVLQAERSRAKKCARAGLPGTAVRQIGSAEEEVQGRPVGGDANLGRGVRDETQIAL